MKQEKFSLKKRARSFGYAFEGIRTLLRDEHNSRIHVVAMACAVALGILLGLSPTEWCIVTLCCGAVLSAEAMNSGIEALADLVSPEFHPLVKKAKDVAAAGVLMTAIAAATAGLIIFLPKLVYVFKGLFV